MGYVGDDCSSFASAVSRYCNKGDRGAKYKDDGRIKSTGITVDTTASGNLISNNSYAAAMINLGYEMYKLDKNNYTWNRYYNNNGKFDNENIGMLTINFLQPGDMLISTNTGENHIEFYIGYEYESSYDLSNYADNELKELNETIKRKNYLKGLVRGNRINKDIVNQIAEGTFGWGGVNDEFPIKTLQNKYRYLKKEKNEAFFRLCECGAKDGINHTKDCCYKTRYYNVIWRKK